MYDLLSVESKAGGDFLKKDGFFPLLQRALTKLRLDMKSVAQDLSKWDDLCVVLMPHIGPISSLLWPTMPCSWELQWDQWWQGPSGCASGRAVALPVTPGPPGKHLLSSAKLFPGVRQTTAASCAYSRSMDRTNIVSYMVDRERWRKETHPWKIL